jgi:hypothetical protein
VEVQASGLQASLNQTAVVENKPGGGSPCPPASLISSDSLSNRTVGLKGLFSSHPSQVTCEQQNRLPGVYHLNASHMQSKPTAELRVSDPPTRLGAPESISTSLSYEFSLSVFFWIQ